MRYKAFISYSHETDTQLASAVQSALRNFAKPWFRLRALHVFRDETSLAANPSLAGSLEKIMRECDYLLLIASPQAARSEWVKKEVGWWLENHSAESILILLSDGDIVWNAGNSDFDWEHSSSLPAELRGRFAQVPLYVDLRWTSGKQREELTLKNQRFRDAVLNIAAPLHGKSKDELDGEDVRQFHRTRRVTLGAAGLILAAAAIAVWQSSVSIRRQQALITAHADAAKQNKIARSRALATEANLHLKDDPELSLLLAHEAAKSAHTSEAGDALRRALTESRVRASLGDAQNPIHHAGFSPNGKRLVTVDGNKRVRVWEAPDWRLIAELPKAAGRILSVTFSPDSKYLLTAGQDGGPKVWEIAGCKQVMEFKGHDGWVGSAEFNPDGKLAVTAGSDYTVRLWDVQSGANLAIFRGHTGVVVGARFSPDSKRLITVDDESDDEHPTRLWDIDTHRLVAYLDGTIPDYDIPNLARTSVFSHDSRFVTTVDEQTVFVWFAANGKAADKLELSTEGRVWGSSFSPAVNELAIADFDGLARIWRLSGKGSTTELRGHTGPVWSAVFSPDGRSVLTSSEDATVRLWDAASGASIDTFAGSAAPLRKAEFSSDARYVVTLGNTTSARIMETSPPGVVELHHTGEANAVAYSPDGNLIATSSFDLSINLWSANTHKPVQTFTGLHGLVICMAFSKDQRLLAAGVSDAAVHLFDVTTGKELSKFDEFGAAIRTVDFSSDGTLLMASAMNGIARIREVETGRLVTEMDLRETPPDLMYEIAFAPSGRLLAVTRRNGSAQILEIPSGKVRATLKGHSDLIQKLRFSDDGHFLVTAGRDGSARIWQTESGNLLAELRGHSGWVIDAGFSNDASLVVTAGEDKAVRIWSVASHQEIAQLRDARRRIWAATFSPDQKTLLTASADGMARIYPAEMFAPIDELVSLAEKRETRKLTPEEARAYVLAEGAR